VRTKAKVPESGASATDRPMLITDAAKKCGLTLGELLAKLDAGELTASCLFSKHAARAIWTAELADGERVSLNFGAIGAKEGKTFVCVSPARIAFPSPNRFVLLDQHARDDDFAALTSDQDVIHPGQFIAVPPTPGHGYTPTDERSFARPGSGSSCRTTGTGRTAPHR